METERLSGLPDKDEVVASIAALAERVAELETRAVQQDMSSLSFSDDKLATIALSIYASRRMRADYFAGSLFGEPVWDMLLDLFVNKIQGRRVSRASLSLATNLPQTTALRWVKVLEEEGLLQRSDKNEDARLDVVELTAEAFTQMRRFIEDSVTRFDMPMPD